MVGWWVFSGTFNIGYRLCCAFYRCFNDCFQCESESAGSSLHFTRGIAEAKCILATAICVSVCLSLHSTLLHGPGCNLGNQVCPLVVHYCVDLQSVHCAPVSLLWQHTHM